MTYYYNCARHRPPQAGASGNKRHGGVKNLGYCPAKLVVNVTGTTEELSIQVRVLNLHSHMCDPYRNPVPLHVRQYIRTRLRLGHQTKDILRDVRATYGGISRLINIRHINAESEYITVISGTTSPRLSLLAYIILLLRRNKCRGDERRKVTANCL